MRSYKFECLGCHSPLLLALSMRERESGSIKCPACGGTEVQQVVSSFMEKTLKKS
ncbi:MAG: zinc ribbon domain-containing protein [Nitrospinae bacterium]|nr:zinc ribbon domain-containing protein [Nitrospinota bacterium]